MKKIVWVFCSYLAISLSFSNLCLAAFDVAASSDESAFNDKSRRLSEQFFIAAINGDVDNIQRLVDQGIQVDSVEDVKNWLDFSYRRQNGYTALHYAAGAGDLRAVETLLKLGARVDIVAPFVGTALHAATMYNNDFGVSRVLLRAGALPSARNGGHFETPLQCAKRFNNRFIKSITDLLFHSAESGDEETIELLSALGLDVNAEYSVSLLYKTRRFVGKRPLHLAVMAGELGVVKRLLSLGVDFLAPDSQNRTPLYLAMEHNQTLSIVDALLDAGASLKKGRRVHFEGNEQYVWPLDYAKKKNPDLYRAYVDRFFGAVSSGDLSAVRRELDAGLDVDIKDKDDFKRIKTNKSALYYAISEGNLALVELLLAYGASVETFSPTSRRDDEIYLRQALRKGNPEIVKALLYAGATLSGNKMFRGLDAPSDISQDMRDILRLRRDQHEFKVSAGYNVYSQNTVTVTPSLESNQEHIVVYQSPKKRRYTYTVLETENPSLSAAAVSRALSKETQVFAAVSRPVVVLATKDIESAKHYGDKPGYERSKAIASVSLERLNSIQESLRRRDDISPKAIRHGEVNVYAETAALKIGNLLAVQFETRRRTENAKVVLGEIPEGFSLGDSFSPIGLKVPKVLSFAAKTEKGISKGLSVGDAMFEAGIGKLVPNPIGSAAVIGALRASDFARAHRLADQNIQKARELLHEGDREGALLSVEAAQILAFMEEVSAAKGVLVDGVNSVVNFFRDHTFDTFLSALNEGFISPVPSPFSDLAGASTQGQSSQHSVGHKLFLVQHQALIERAVGKERRAEPLGRFRRLMTQVGQERGDAVATLPHQPNSTASRSRRSPMDMGPLDNVFKVDFDRRNYSSFTSGSSQVASSSVAAVTLPTVPQTVTAGLAAAACQAVNGAGVPVGTIGNTPVTVGVTLTLSGSPQHIADQAVADGRQLLKDAEREVRNLGKGAERVVREIIRPFRRLF